MHHSNLPLHALSQRCINSAIWAILAPLLLTACATQDHFYEQNTVYFSDSGSSITETRSANYPPNYYPAYHNSTPINAAIAVSGEQIAGAISVQSPPAYYPPPYPQSNIRTYQSGNSSITRGTYYPSPCQQRYHRGGKTYYRPIPCPH